MSGKQYEFGIRFTGDGRVAVAESGRVEQAVESVGKAAERSNAQITTSSGQAQQAASSVGKAAVAAGAQVEQSAKQTAFAMRMLPAQMTDVAVGLASGQSPFMVLIQQGGQLKDTFGGVGPAVRAVGGYVVGLVNPLTVASAAAAGMALAFAEGRRESDDMARSIIMTGNAAGTTVGQMQAASRSIAEATGATRGAVAEALTQIVATGKVSSDIMERVGAAAVRMERAGGPAVADTVAQFAELGRAPVEASLKLNEQTNYLTASVYRQIKALSDQGDASGAAAIAQSAWADALEERLPKMEAKLGSLQKAWLEVTGIAKKAWDAMLDIGREEGLSEKVKSTETKIASIRATMEAARNNNAYDPMGSQAEVLRLQERLKLAESELAILQRHAAAEAEKAREAAKGKDQFDRQVKAMAEVEKSATHQIWLLQQQRELLKELPDSADKRRRELEINRQIEAVYRSMGADARQLTEARIGGELKLAEVVSRGKAEQIDVEMKLGKITNEEYARRRLDEEISLIAAKKLAIERRQGIALLTAAEKENLASEAAALDAEAANARQRWDSAPLIERKKRFDDLTKAAETQGRQELDALDKAIAQQRLHNAEIGLTAEQKARAEQATYAYTTRQFEEEAENLRIAASVVAMDQEYKDFYTRRANQLDAIIERRKRLAGLMGDEAVREANASAARYAVEEWKRGLDDTNHVAREMFMIWARDGSNAGKKIGETLKASLLGAIYEATLKPAVVKIYTAVTGGPPGGAGIPGMPGGFNALNGVGNVGYSMYGSFATSGLGQSIGLSEAVPYFANAELGTEAVAAMSTELTAAGQAISGAMGSIGAAMPYVAAAMFVASMLSSKGGGPKRGGDAVYSLASSRASLRADLGDENYGGFFTPSDANADVAKTVQMAVSGLASLATTLGGAGVNLQQFGLGFDSDPQGSAGNRVATRVVDAGGKSVYSSLRDFGRDQAALEKGMSEELQRMTLAALGTVDLAPWADRMVAEIDPVTASADQVAAALQQLTDMAALVPLFEAVGVSADTLSQSLVDALGGAQRAGTTLGAYLESYYSAEEKRARQTALVTAELDKINVAMPTTREAYRATVEHYEQMGPAGATTVAALLNVAAAFAELVPPTTAVATTMRSAADIASERAGLERRLLEVNGDTVALRTLEREAIDASNRALYDEIAVREEQKRTDEAAAAAAATRQEMRDRLDVLTGTKTQTQIDRARQLASVTDAATVAIMKNVWALEDQRDAAAVTAERMRSANQENLAALNEAKSTLVSAFNEQIGAQQRIADQYRSIAGSLTNLKAGLALGNLSPLGPMEKYAEAAAQVRSLYAKAKLGDADAERQFEQAVQSWLTASQAVNASSEMYAADYRDALRMIDEVQATAQRQSTIASEQITLLQGQMDRLDLVAENTKSIETLLAEYLAIKNAVSVTNGTTNAANNQFSYIPVVAASSIGGTAVNDTVYGGAIPQYVARQYQSILGRTADDAGLAYWSDKLASGAVNMGNFADVMRTEAAQYLADPERKAAYLATFGSLPSHADGLESVPYDGYVAMLHHDEAVVDVPSRRAIERFFGATPRAANDAPTVGAIRDLTERVDRLIAAVENGHGLSAAQARELKQHLAATLSAAVRKAA